MQTREGKFLKSFLNQVGTDAATDAMVRKGWLVEEILFNFVSTQPTLVQWDPTFGSDLGTATSSAQATFGFSTMLPCILLLVSLALLL